MCARWNVLAELGKSLLNCWISQSIDNGSIELRHMRNVVKVYELRQVAIFDAVFSAYILMLVVVVLAEFGKTHRRKAGPIERKMIAAAQNTQRVTSVLSEAGPSLSGYRASATRLQTQQSFNHLFNAQHQFVQAVNAARFG